MFRTVILAAGILTAIAAAMPAQAGFSVNGVSFNGISLNGLSLNGMSINGLSLNGAKMNSAAMHEPTGGVILMAIELPAEMR